MTCASCAMSVEKQLKGTPGIQEAVVNLADNSVRLTWDPEAIDSQGMKQSLGNMGYTLHIELANENNTKGMEHDMSLASRRRAWMAGALAFPVFVLGMFFMHAGAWAQWVSMALTLATMAWPGRHFYINAIKRARHGSANMDTLVALSTAIAFAYSAFNTAIPHIAHQYGMHAHVYFESAAVIVAFVLLGKYLEDRAKHRSGQAVRALLSLQPTEVTVVRNGQEMRVSIADIRPMDRVMVAAGGRIPVDGLVAAGTSYVDESMLTGEPMPVAKAKKDKVFAGTLNQLHPLTILAGAVGKETLLAQIVETVKKAQGSKAPVQRRADAIASVFVPVVLAISVLTVAIWLVMGGMDALPLAINSAIAVLVIACPCALGLATPTALMVGMGRAATAGILIKDAAQMEMAAHIRRVVLDKTGTLTEGHPELVDQVWWSTDTKEVLVAIEKKSEHPLARAVAEGLAKAGGLGSLPEVQAHTTLPGQGIEATVGGLTYLVGKPQWIGSKAGMPLLPQSGRDDETQTVVGFATGKSWLALLFLQDAPKPDAQEGIAALRRLGVEPHLLSGDRYENVAHLAKELGISKWKSNVLPSEKGAYIKDLQRDGATVAMVGDGINDAEALAQAQVGIAMARGTDIALEVAGMTLIHGKVGHVAAAISISKKTVKVIRQNLFWAFAYNVACIPIAAGILYPINGFLLDPMIAGAAMSFSSVSVVANSLRLKKAKI